MPASRLARGAGACRPSAGPRARCAPEFRRHGPTRPTGIFASTASPVDRCARSRSARRSRDILGHGFFRPGRTRRADEYGKRERHPGAKSGARFQDGAAFAWRQFQVQRDFIAAATAGFTRTTCASVSGGTPEANWRRKETRSTRASQVARLVALHANAITRYIQGARRFQAHAESSTPANARGQAELRARMLTQFGGLGDRNHGCAS